ncbi:MAG TPA: CRISPR-associated endonuclease Cas2 [Thermoanaerobaculia bacterium]|nr:CRISPR-associated endonuclease Cas2 [Thermoanaerobaculia bacterium]
MRFVVAYDISDDKKRTKVAEMLQNFLTRVQLSVFEGDLEPAVLARVVKKALPLLDVETDSIRVYRLCGTCAPRVDVYGAGVKIRTDEVTIL